MEQMKEINEVLRKAGLELTGKAVLVPHYDCTVQAGLPTESDPYPYASDGTYIPKELLGYGTYYTINVRGESMIDFDINEGDRLLVRLQSTAKPGDVVIASINGATTVKTYFEDEDGDYWLIPGNVDFTPFRLEPSNENRIIGVVDQIIHKNPRASLKDCMQSIRKYKQSNKSRYSAEDIARALRVARDYISGNNLSSSRPWFAVYRTFTDKGIINNGDYNGFVDLLERIMGDQAPTINIRDMRDNVDQYSFASRVSMWTADNAPCSTTKFYSYLEIAKETNKALRG